MTVTWPTLRPGRTAWPSRCTFTPGPAALPWTAGPDHESLDDGEPGVVADLPAWPFDPEHQNRSDQPAAWAYR